MYQTFDDPNISSGLSGGSTTGGGALGAGLGYLLPAAGNLISTSIDAVSRSRQQRKQNEANFELAKYSYGKDLEMWHRANSYNSPTAQMRRLRDAGLNPNLVYGNGAVGNSSSAGPSFQTPAARYNFEPNVDFGVFSAFQDIRMRNAQIDNVSQNTAYIAQKTVNESVNEELKRIDKGLKSIRLDYSPMMSQYQLSALQSRVENQQQDLRNKQAIYNNLLIQNSIKSEYMKKLQNDVKLQDYELQWRRQGITSSDNLLLRFLVRQPWFSNALSGGIDWLGDKFNKYLPKWD